MEQGFYDLPHGGPVDRVLPIIVRRISDIGDQAQTTAHRVMEMRATMEVMVERTRDLERDYYPMDGLVEDLTTTQAEVREYQERHVALEERVLVAEHRLAELQGASTSSQAPQGSTRRD